MIIFNTTFHAEPAMSNEFLIWLKEEYVPTAIKSSLLSEPRLCHVMNDSEAEGISYSLQFEVKNMDALNRWYEECGISLNETLVDRFKNKIIGFSTLLKTIDIEDIK